MSQYLDRNQVIELYKRYQPSLSTHVYEFGEKLMALPIVKEIPLAELDTTNDFAKWIPCSERLPKKSGEYYVSGGDKVWICSFLIIPTFKGGWCNNVSNPVVEAWMPLPERYGEEAKTNESD